jgi:predicted  nucleic acid-binding Zn-ribbon protein
MHPELTKLLDLQAHDLELLAVDARMFELGTRIGTLDEELGKARETVNAAQRSIDAEQKKRDELEARTDAHRKHQEKRKEKLEFMKTPKEVAALMAEIDLARGVLSNEESEWVRSADQVGILENRKKELENQMSAVESAQAEVRADLKTQRDAIAAERQEVLDRREASAVLVSKPLLQRYDKLRGNRKSAVVVPLAGPACGACFTQVPVNRRSQIKAGAIIEGCESCGVILYFAE